MNYSFFFTLPHAWVDHHGLCKNDIIRVAIDEVGRLILEPEK